jgi:hypothetical protein
MTDYTVPLHALRRLCGLTGSPSTPKQVPTRCVVFFPLDANRSYRKALIGNIMITFSIDQKRIVFIGDTQSNQSKTEATASSKVDEKHTRPSVAGTTLQPGDLVVVYVRWPLSPLAANTFDEYVKQPVEGTGTTATTALSDVLTAANKAAVGKLLVVGPPSKVLTGLPVGVSAYHTSDMSLIGLDTSVTRK